MDHIKYAVKRAGESRVEEGDRCLWAMTVGGCRINNQTWLSKRRRMTSKPGAVSETKGRLPRAMDWSMDSSHCESP